MFDFNPGSLTWVGLKKPGTNILPLFSLQCDKIQCQSGTTMTAALYGRWVDWPHISVEILPSLVFNECSHVFLQGNKIIRTFQSVNVDPLHVLLVRRLKLFWHQFLQNFVSTQAWARVQLNEEKNRKKLKTQRSNWRWFSASCSASFLRSHHVRCCRLE